MASHGDRCCRDAFQVTHNLRRFLYRMSSSQIKICSFRISGGKSLFSSCPCFLQFLIEKRIARAMLCQRLSKVGLSDIFIPNFRDRTNRYFVFNKPAQKSNRLFSEREGYRHIGCKNDSRGTTVQVSFVVLIRDRLVFSSYEVQGRYLNASQVNINTSRTPHTEGVPVIFDLAVIHRNDHHAQLTS